MTSPVVQCVLKTLIAQTGYLYGMNLVSYILGTEGQGDDVQLLGT